MSDNKKPAVQEHVCSEVPYDVDALLEHLVTTTALEGTPLRIIRNELTAALQDFKQLRKHAAGEETAWMALGVRHAAQKVEEILAPMENIKIFTAGLADELRKEADQLELKTLKEHFDA